jgi:hypothetical protein
MERRFNSLSRLIALLLVCQILCGCPSVRIEKIDKGADVKPPPQEFAVGRTTLAEVLNFYGAPFSVVDMKGYFAITYLRAFYRGAQLSLSIPLNEVVRMSPAFDAAGNLSRYDEAVFIFTSEGTLAGMSYEKGTAHPLWKTYWK